MEEVVSVLGQMFPRLAEALPGLIAQAAQFVQSPAGLCTVPFVVLLMGTLVINLKGAR